MAYPWALVGNTEGVPREALRAGPAYTTWSPARGVHAVRFTHVGDRAGTLEGGDHVGFVYGGHGRVGVVLEGGVRPLWSRARVVPIPPTADREAPGDTWVLYIEGVPIHCLPTHATMLNSDPMFPLVELTPVGDGVFRARTRETHLPPVMAHLPSLAHYLHAFLRTCGVWVDDWLISYRGAHVVMRVYRWHAN